MLVFLNYHPSNQEILPEGLYFTVRETHILVYLVWNSDTSLSLPTNGGKYQTDFSEVWYLPYPLKMLLVHARGLSTGLLFPITHTNMLLEPTPVALIS